MRTLLADALQWLADKVRGKPDFPPLRSMADEAEALRKDKARDAFHAQLDRARRDEALERVRKATYGNGDGTGNVEFPDSVIRGLKLVPRKWQHRNADGTMPPEAA